MVGGDGAMGLTTCPDCKREISSAARHCPHCGRPLQGESVADTEFHGRGEGIFMKSLNCGCMVVLGFVLLGIVLLVFGSFMASTR